MKFISCPYSHEDPAIEKQRFELVTLITSEMLGRGENIFSPITYGHTLCIHGKLPGDWNFWQSFCRDMIDVCDELIVLKMEGWEKSVGVAAEIAYAKSKNIPVRYIDVDPKYFHLLSSFRSGK